MSITNEQLDEKIEIRQVVEIIGVISGKLASPEYADAWSGNAPDWFPEPPEWLDLLEEALAVTPLKRDETLGEIAASFPDHDFPEQPGISAEDFLEQYPQVSAQPPVDPDDVDHDCGCG